MGEKVLYPCPVCGKKCYTEPQYSFEICPVCGWEDDLYQLQHPNERGANGHWTLSDAQEAWKKGMTLFPTHPNPNAKK